MSEANKITVEQYQITDTTRPGPNRFSVCGPSFAEQLGCASLTDALECLPRDVLIRTAGGKNGAGDRAVCLANRILKKFFGVEAWDINRVGVPTCVYSNLWDAFGFCEGHTGFEVVVSGKMIVRPDGTTETLGE